MKMLEQRLEAPHPTPPCILAGTWGEYHGISGNIVKCHGIIWNVIYIYIYDSIYIYINILCIPFPENGHIPLFIWKYPIVYGNRMKSWIEHDRNVLCMFPRDILQQSLDGYWGKHGETYNANAAQSMT